METKRNNLIIILAAAFAAFFVTVFCFAFNPATVIASADSNVFSITVLTEQQSEYNNNTTKAYISLNSEISLESFNFRYLWEKESDTTAGDYSQVSKIAELIFTGTVSDNGNYRVTVSRYNNANSYIIDSVQQTFSIANTAIERTVIWDAADEFTYNGTVKKPSAYIIGVNNARIDLIVTGGAIDARKTAYTATASLNDANYTLTGDTAKEFYIKPLAVTADWGNTVLEYNGAIQHPLARALAISNIELDLNYSGGAKECSSGNETYSVSASPVNGNYILANASVEFTIIKRTINEIKWNSAANISFNGSDRRDNIYAFFDNGSGVNQALALTFDREQVINAGSYRVTAGLTEEQTNSYIISADAVTEATFVISKAKPSIVIDNRDITVKYSGTAYSLDAYCTSGETLYIYNDIYEVPNYFNSPGIYAITLTTRESANYLPSESVNVTLTILKTDFSEHLNGFEFTSDTGLHPAVTLSVTALPEDTDIVFSAPWGLEKAAAYKIEFLNGENAVTSGLGVYRFRVPEELENNENLKAVINTASGSKLITLDIVDGYISFEAENLEAFAIMAENINGIGLWIVVISAAVLIIIVVLLFVFKHKSNRIG